MKYSKKEALEEIFAKRDLTAVERVYKSRYKKGDLGDKSSGVLLKKYGFKMRKEAVYER
jgi:hypothetical protein